MLCTRQIYKTSKAYLNATMPGCFLGPCVRLVEYVAASEKIKKYEIYGKYCYKELFSVFCPSIGN